MSIHNTGSFPTWDGQRALEAQVARWNLAYLEADRRATLAEARLAAVEALCEATHPWVDWIRVDQIRAAARGEGDRG